MHESRLGPLATFATFATLATPVLPACADSRGPTTGKPDFTARDSAGVELAVTTFAGPAPVTGWTIGDAPEVVYGESADDEVHFVRIQAARQLPDGKVVAIDRRLRKLFIFTPTGALLARAGREGDGPGEFRGPVGMVHLGGDTILVYDDSHMRFSLYDTDGGFLDDRRLEQPEVEEISRLILYVPVDAVGDTVTLRGDSYFFRITTSEDFVWELPTLRYTTAGSLLDEVAEPMKVWFYGTRDGPQTRLFDGRQTVAGRDGLVYVGDRERYEVRVYDPPRGLIRIDRLERPRRPVTNETLEQYKSYAAESVHDPDERKEMLDFVDRKPVADSLPWISRVTADALGNLWVEEYVPPGGGSGEVGVFSADGPWIGAVRLPPNFHPLDIGDDYVLGVATDELDVPHLVRYGLER